MRDAFISYSSTDSAEAYAVRNYLQRSGCTCWMAPDDISAGSDYADAIPKAIADCRTFVLILSPDAQNSNWVRKELGKALDKGKTVIPFMIRNFKLNDTFDFLLENAQWCHAYTNRDAALTKMLAAVKAQQGTYRYTPQSTATPPRQTTPPPKQTTAAPKAAATAPRSSSPQARPRPTTTVFSSAKTVPKLMYGLMVWGLFCSITLLLGLLCFFLSEHTGMGTHAFWILGIGMWAAIFLLIAGHKNDRIYDGILSAKRNHFARKLLLWLILTVGIFFTLVVIGGMTYLQIANQDSFTPDQIALLAVCSGVASLAMLIRWLRN